jgi:alpha 1,3-glucosidase
MVYSGSDVGGFFRSPDPELLSRWHAVGAWLYPFFRSHPHHSPEYREVYTIECEAREVAREAIQERYRLLPYWYALARVATGSGVPIVRPRWWEFPEGRFADVDDRAMLGSALLIVPFLERGDASITVDLPEGRWYRWSKLNEVAGKIDVPYHGGRTAVFLRGGSIVPMKERIRKSSELMFVDPFQIVVGLNGEGKAEGELYVDDGETFKFVQEGEFVHRKIVFEGNVLKSVPAVGSGQFKDFQVVIEQIKIAGLKRPPKTVVGGEGQLQFDWEGESEVLTILRTQIPVNGDFTIVFNF